MVGFKHHHVGQRDILLDPLGHAAHVGGHHAFQIAMIKRIPHRFRRIVRNSERLDAYAADFQPQAQFAPIVGLYMMRRLKRVPGPTAGIDRRFELAGENRQAADMVAMLMRH